MTRTCAPLLTVLLLSAPLLASAEGLGLDLNEENPEPPPVEKPPEIPDERPPLDLGAPEKKPDVATAVGEEDVSLEDRVKAVQRKHFLKGGRVEALPAFSISLNDAFYTKIGGGLRLTYHFADPVGVSLHFNKYGIAQTDNVKIAKRELRSLLLSSKLDWESGVGLVFTPIYGKLGWFNTLVSYDFFLLGGVGAAYSQTSGEPVNDGVHPSAHVGLGQRFSLTDWMTAQFWVQQVVYADRPQDREISDIQKVLTANIGVAFFLPPSFEYEVQ